MSDLFSKKQPTKGSYSAHDIEILEGLEPVRHRPGMYIGGTDEGALHHLAAEILDNAMDEAVAGHASQIHLFLRPGNFLSIQDDGRGIPTDPHPKYPALSALEVILTTLHAGGKFKQGAYETAGGLHGVGLSVVNALSDSLEVLVSRDKKSWRQTYAAGKPSSPITPLTPQPFPRGTQITFHPDPSIFDASLVFKPQLLYRMLKAKAFLYKGVKLFWNCDPSLLPENSSIPATETFYFPQGLVDYVQNLSHGATPLLETPFAGTLELAQNAGKIEWAMTWIQGQDASIQSFCNTIPTPQGGTHETGFKTALTRALKTFGDFVKNKKTSTITTDDVFSSSLTLLSIFIRDPQFQGQTKEKLVSSHVAKWVETTLKDYLDHWFADNSTTGQTILEHVIAEAEERMRLKSLKETQRKNPTQRLRLPGKLADCSRQTAQGTELFLVEGESAGGSAKQARNRETQAVLPLKGKILNVANATQEKVFANQEINNLVQALGAGVDQSFSLAQLRYERVIIMTDADIDGAHIASLLLTFFFQKMRPLIHHGRLFLAEPPLYKLAQGAKSFYAKTEEEKEHLLKTEFKGSAKVDISRFKGLGEMNPSQLKETTMNPEKRGLTRVELKDSEDLGQLLQFVEDLMGKRAEKRYEFIQQNARFAHDLDL